MTTPRYITATIVFGLAGLAGFLFAPEPWALRLPNGVFYATLVLNTFYSVRYFDAQPPVVRDERIIDGILAVNYLVLAAAIGSPVTFALLSGVLFAFAIVKYALLLSILEPPHTLVRKMRINVCGLLMCAATFFGAAFIDGLWSAWGQAILFALANLYLLVINPMYGTKPVFAFK